MLGVVVVVVDFMLRITAPSDFRPTPRRGFGCLAWVADPLIAPIIAPPTLHARGFQIALFSIFSQFLRIMRTIAVRS